MKVKRYTDIRKNFTAGTTVWACAFAETGDKEGKALHTAPVKGMLMPFKYEMTDDQKLCFEANPSAYDIKFFIPFKKNGTDLAYSKAVMASSRCYATSQEECLELYCELIQGCIKFHEDSVLKLRNLMLDAQADVYGI